MRTMVGTLHSGLRLARRHKMTGEDRGTGGPGAAHWPASLPLGSNEREAKARGPR